MAQGLTTAIVYPTRKETATLVKTVCFAGQATAQYDPAQDKEANHRAAAAGLLQDLGWDGRWVGGSVQGRVGQSKVAFVRCADGPLSVEFSRGLASLGEAAGDAYDAIRDSVDRGLATVDIFS